MPFENFDLLLSALPAVRITAAPSTGPTDPLPFDLDTDRMIDRYERMLLGGYLPEEEIKRLGYNLFQAIFQRKVLAEFYKSQGIASSRGAGLRLRLQIDTPALARLPWELLFTDDKEFISLSGTYTFCRYLPVERPARPLPIELPLRILMLASAPAGLPPLDVKTEVETLKTALSTMGLTGGVELEVEYDARRPQLLSRLQTSPVHVLHFVGHGDLTAEGGLIFLEDEQTQPDPVEPAAFAGLLSVSPSLRLVVLNACATAAEAAQRGFSSVASHLVKAGVPAVVAMRNAVEDQVAISFARHLYNSLAAGASIDVAITRARQQLYHERTANPIAFALPVLYLHSPDGSLFDIADSFKKRLTQVAQRVDRLIQTAEALAEWKELHDTLHILYQSIDEVHKEAPDPAAASLVRSHWNLFRANLNGRLLPFARDHIRYVGRRYSEREGSRQGEPWAVRTVELAGQVEPVLQARQLVLVRDLAGDICQLFFEHLTRCSNEMVRLIGVINQLVAELKSELDRLRAEQGQVTVPFSWDAIASDLTELEQQRTAVEGWISLHSLYDRLQLGFSTVAAFVPGQSFERLVSTTALKQSWDLVRNTLVRDLLERARQIAPEGNLFDILPDGQLSGEPWAVDIKRASDRLDALLSEANGSDDALLTTIIGDLNALIRQYYLMIDGKIKNQMILFNHLTADLKRKVAR